MALPLLEAMLPGRARAAEAAKAPTRMAFVFFPNGVIKPSWDPGETGADYKLTETLEPLAPYKADFNVISGLAQDNARDKGDGAGDHARSAAAYLTGVHPYKTAGANIRAGVSVDQVAAAFAGRFTRLPSLEIGVDGGSVSGDCDSGYSCAYSSNISWKSATTPMAKEMNPKLVFQRLFGSRVGVDKKRDAFRKSILDFVADDASRLKGRLGQTDRRKLDEYFSSVRELESRIERAGRTLQQRPDNFTPPDAVPEETELHIRLMYDLLLLAFQTDSTRICTFMLANEGSNRSYTMVGVREGHHSLSHHQGKQENIDQLKKIDKFLIEQFAYFLGKLKSIPEGDGTLLDHSMIVYGSGIADGNAHSHHDLPILLAGRANGTIATGRHIKFDRDTPMNNLFLSMLDRMGATVEKIGDSSGRLTGLEA
jgi:hypothetical protein